MNSSWWWFIAYVVIAVIVISLVLVYQPQYPASQPPPQPQGDFGSAIQQATGDIADRYQALSSSPYPYTASIYSSIPSTSGDTYTSGEVYTYGEGDSYEC